MHYLPVKLKKKKQVTVLL